MTLIVDVVEAPSGAPVELTKQAAAKTWANLNGTGTIALADSLNISSTVDNGTGDYTLNFTNNFAAADFAVTGMAGLNSGSGTNLPMVGIKRATSIAVGSIQLHTKLNQDAGLTDLDQIMLSVFGDLA